MITEKKNQHYIPKFYLRNFSFQSNGKQIGIFNINNQIFIQKSKLKTQGSKNFFYGYDGIIEDKLANLEGNFSATLTKIIENKTLPNVNTLDHLNLISFIAFTDLRNPVKINGVKSLLKGMNDHLMQLDPTVDIDKFVPKSEHEDIVKLILSQAEGVIINTLDLEYKLLINETTRPFIASDFPVVKYNQFLELEKWQHSKSGYGSVGLQIIVPINSSLALLFFDSSIYKVGDKKKRFLGIKNIADIDSINILQFINCFETIFFDEKASGFYIKQLYQKSKKYKRANDYETKLSFIVNEGEDKSKVLNGKENLLMFGSSDCECRLKINGIKIHSRGKAYKFNNSVVQLRASCKNYRKNYR